MDIDNVGGNDVSYLEPELLHLPDVSPFELKPTTQVAEELFSQWLSFPDTSRLVKSLVRDAKAGLPINAHGISSGFGAGGSSSVTNASPPPLSPRNSCVSPRTSKLKASPFSLASPRKLATEPVQEVIPQFYFQHGRPPPNELKEQCLSRINRLFNNNLDGLHIDEFKSVTKEVCNLPSFFSSILFRRIDAESYGIVTRYLEVQLFSILFGNNLLPKLFCFVFLANNCLLKQSWITDVLGFSAHAMFVSDVPSSLSFNLSAGMHL
ncbi:Serine/threonine protein phosphatase 2A regulatory subunit B''alpha [Linum perenne]